MKPTILIVDDSAMMRSMLKRAAASGAPIGRVLEATNSREALDVLGREHVDALFTDLNMPEMGGADLLRHVKECRELDRLLPGTPLVPLIVYLMTAGWALRLTAHMVRRIRSGPEDFRYLNWRKEWGTTFYWRSWLQVFILQAFFLLIIAAPLFIAAPCNATSLQITQYPGLVIWTAGWVIQLTADEQLHRFRKQKNKTSRFLQTGLWKYSRHPNYLGEIMMWWGIFFFVAPLPHGGWAVISPNSVQADTGAGLTRGIIGLCNRGQPRRVDDWGALRAWAWGASRLLDHFETDPAVDAQEPGLGQSPNRDALPDRVELAPTRHAVDIHLDLRARQLVELVPGPAFFLFDLTPHPEIPGGGVEMRHRSIM